MDFRSASTLNASVGEALDVEFSTQVLEGGVERIRRSRFEVDLVLVCGEGPSGIPLLGGNAHEFTYSNTSNTSDKSDKSDMNGTN